MRETQLKKAVDLARKVGYVFLATANDSGTPHIAAAGQIAQAEEDCVTVSEWFCPGTVRNLQGNPAVSIVVWDKDSDCGFQMLGRLRSVKNIGILDGYMPGLEEHPPLPQVEKQLLICIEKILDFKGGPHSDRDTKEQDYPLFI